MNEEINLLKRINAECEKNHGNITTINYDENPNERRLVHILKRYGYIENAIQNPTSDFEWIRITEKGKKVLKDYING